MTNALLEEVRDFWNDVEETFLLELKQRDPKAPVLVEYEDREKPQTNFYLLNDTVKTIIQRMYQLIGNAIPDNFFNVIDENDGNFRVGTAGSVFVRTNNNTMAEKCAKLADDLIHHSDNRKSEIEVRLKAFDDTLGDIAK
ncbi:MAG: hypothetical protein JO297_13835 [Nitrososphaeraceae archaeon]|nr:hypothetical protein [Nitrososphaeraceae archaeon]